MCVPACVGNVLYNDYSTTFVICYLLFYHTRVLYSTVLDHNVPTNANTMQSRYIAVKRMDHNVPANGNTKFRYGL